MTEPFVPLKLEPAYRKVAAVLTARITEGSLQPGERCVFTLKSGLKDARGEGVGGRSEYRFFAPGPWPRPARAWIGRPVSIARRSDSVSSGSPGRAKLSS